MRASFTFLFGDAHLFLASYSVPTSSGRLYHVTTLILCPPIQCPPLSDPKSCTRLREFPTTSNCAHLLRTTLPCAHLFRTPSPCAHLFRATFILCLVKFGLSLHQLQRRKNIRFNIQSQTHQPLFTPLAMVPKTTGL